MRRARLILGAFALGAIGHFAGMCEASDEPRMRVFPEEIQLHGARDRHGLIVLARKGVDWLDVSDRVMLNVQTGAVAGVEGRQLVPRSNGKTRVQVSWGDASAEVWVTVVGMSESQAPSFLSEVEPLFTRFGCNQGGVSWQDCRPERVSAPASRVCA
jgi:hypothetical protein